MRITCKLDNLPLSFDIQEVDDWDQTVVYRVESLTQTAFYETHRRNDLPSLAEAGIVALVLDLVSDVKEET